MANSIPQVIQVIIEVNRECLSRGEPPLGLVAVHEADGLPDDALLRDPPVLKWAIRNGIGLPVRWTDDARRTFHQAIIAKLVEWQKTHRFSDE